jgi:Fe-S-cluster containining protein
MADEDKQARRNLERIADAARKKVGRYCYEECGAYCCRKGYLVMNRKQADLVTAGKTDDMEKTIMLKRISEDRYSLNLNKTCPSLDMDELKCKIHKKRLRPKPCKEFPIFIKDGTVIFSSRCPAVRSGFFFPYEKAFVRKGLKIKQMHDCPEWICC